MNGLKKAGRLRLFAADYGMIFVLLGLMTLFTLLTWKEQVPVGADAAVDVTNRILQGSDGGVSVIVLAGDSAADHAFVTTATERLTAAGATILETVNGQPADALRAMNRVNATDLQPTHLAVTGTANRWPVFVRSEFANAGERVAPLPYRGSVFAQPDNLKGVANQTAVYAVIAIGMTMVIITGGIDLSVGSLVALASVTAAVLIRKLGGTSAGIGEMTLGILAGLGICASAGIFHGLMVTRFRIPPFIVSLSMMMMARGLAYLMADGQSISALPDGWTAVGAGKIGGVPAPILIMIVLYVLAHVVMSHTAFGRYVYAVGGNQEAARLCGVPITRVLLAVYTICGALAGLGGLILSSRLHTGDPKLGVMYELEVIAAVVVGGTSLMGGEGRILGTLIGAFIIAVLNNGMNLLAVGDWEQRIILGAVLLVAVLIDNLKRDRTH